jgi:hypothetical protein
MKSQTGMNELDPWRARQAAMLYHYASLDCLRALKIKLDTLLAGLVEPLLDSAEAQGRDGRIANSKWGERDTSRNWANNAWPLLKDFQQELAKQIAMRSFGQYGPTRVDEYIRGVEQFSMLWASEQEEDAFNAALEPIVKLAGEIDDTLDDEMESQWDDHGFAYGIARFAEESPRIPRFRIRTDIQTETGNPAPRPGVYVSASDPNAALQFAYPGPDGCNLRQASTFSEIGLEVLHALGRESLWFDEAKMFHFAMNSKHSALFKDSIVIGNEVFEDLASSAIAQHAFENEHSQWYFVEIAEENVFETLPIWASITGDSPATRVVGGTMCNVSGYYISPSKIGLRSYFSAGEILPKFQTDYGITIWQFDSNQN